jgi:hypothetical protein
MLKRFCAILVPTLLFGQPAQALQIDLFDQGGFGAATPQYAAFRSAANYWESIITTNTTLRIDINFTALGAAGPIGTTSAFYYVDNVGTILSAMQGVASSPIDTIVSAHLPDASSGSIAMWTPGYTDPLLKTGADPASKVFDNDGSNNNVSYGVTWGLGKALGLVTVDSLKDGSIEFNSDLTFDFDPIDGITAGSFDFTFTAFHEIGHIMGFTSGVDYYDAFAPSDGYNWNLDWIGHGMDLFRYSADGLDWSMGGSPFFSIDGGATNLLGGAFSTGVNFGNGSGASHWLEGQGIMDPTSAPGEMGGLTALDLAAFDALGWNLKVDPLASPSFYVTTGVMASPPAAIPEPASWILSISGFALLGGMMRRQSRPVRLALAAAA